MTLPLSRAAYADYYRIWDAAIADGSGIRLRVESYDSAIHHRMWLHKARAIHKEESRELYEPGDPRYGVSPYDHYMVTIRPAPGEADFYLIISPRTLGILGQIESLTGTEYEPQWQSSPLVEHESPPLLSSPSGTKLLPARSASESDASTDPSSSKPSTTPEKPLAIPGSRRL